MAATFHPKSWTSALRQLKAAPRTQDERVRPTGVDCDQREQFKVKVIEARVKLKLMRDRTDALKDALQRYRTREATRA